jgi:hypothetical protein
MGQSNSPDATGENSRACKRERERERVPVTGFPGFCGSRHFCSTVLCQLQVCVCDQAPAPRDVLAAAQGRDTSERGISTAAGFGVMGY